MPIPVIIIFHPDLDDQDLADIREFIQLVEQDDGDETTTD